MGGSNKVLLLSKSGDLVGGRVGSIAIFLIQFSLVLRGVTLFAVSIVIFCHRGNTCGWSDGCGCGWFRSFYWVVHGYFIVFVKGGRYWWWWRGWNFPEEGLIPGVNDQEFWLIRHQGLTRVK